MQKCKTTEVVTIPSGVFKLNEGQIKRRTHMLVKVKGGHEITQPIQFKAGEEFGYEGPVDRALAGVLGLTEKQAEKLNKAHAKAEAEMVGDNSEAEKAAAEKEAEEEAARVAAEKEAEEGDDDSGEGSDAE